jgi:hypothetical protein
MTIEHVSTAPARRAHLVFSLAKVLNQCQGNAMIVHLKEACDDSSITKEQDRLLTLLKIDYFFIDI